MSLELSYERCVRTRAVSASCRACVDACPVQAVSLAPPRGSVAVALDDCVACGVCQAACPTEALRGAFDVPALLAPAPAELRCGQGGLPCVGALSAEDLLAAALKAGTLAVVAQTCAAGSTGHPRAKAAVEQARAFLGAIGAGVTIAFADESQPQPAPAKAPPTPVPPRRQFLGMFVPGAVPQRLSQPERLDVKALRDAAPTARRQRLLAALPADAEPRLAELDGARLDFTSSKLVNDATCTGCVQCVTACPTGALTTPRLRQQLRFDASRCVKCHLCHDVCEPRALTLAPAFRVADFLDFAPKVLVRLSMTQCGECGASYKADGREDALCPRCREHDADARELWRPS